MDETAPPPTTATSTSAAAMADSASTKISGGLGGASAKATTSVKLVIKASNQQYEDLAIDSDLLWTVKQLKAHISAVYPSKPDVADQKLIYSGQLLNDSACIKDVIRSYKDVYTQNHVIHLVCANKLNPNLRCSSAAPRMANAAMNGTATPAGGENRSSAAANATTATASPFPDQQVPQGFPFMLPPHMVQHQQRNGTQQQINYLDAMRQLQQMQQQSHTMPHSPYAYATPWNAQQMAAGQYYQWMHHMYNQYMQQFAQLASTPFPVNGNPHPFMSPHTSQGSSVIPPSGPSATAAAAAPLVAGTAAPQAAQAEPQAEGEMAIAAPAADVPARRFPNIVQDEDEDPRDWLELFFTMTRLAIFLTVLYFNSSPLRCLAVCTIALGIYFYHTRLFVRRAERNNNNINRNNNAADAAEQIQQGVRQVQHAQAQAEQQQEQPEGEVAQPADEDQALRLRRRANAGAAADGAEGEAAPGAEPAVTAVTSQTDNNNNNATVISVVRTFVVTFFTSLLPETPAL